MAVEIDLEDIVGVQAAERCGFVLVDCLVTYVANSERPPASRPPIDPAFELQSFSRDQLDQVRFSDVEHILDFMRSAFRVDRYHMDPWLPAARSHEVYVEWFKNILNGKWASGIHLVSRDGRVVGFCSSGREEAELAELYGIRMKGKGLAGAIPEGRGAYSVLTEMVSTRLVHGIQFGEWDTQIQNVAVINIWLRHGLTYMRGRYMLHKWIGSQAETEASNTDNPLRA